MASSNIAHCNVTSLATSLIGSSSAGSLKTVTIGGYTYTVTTLDLQKEQEKW